MTAPLLVTVHPDAPLGGGAGPVTVPAALVVLRQPDGTVVGIALPEGPPGVVRLARPGDADFPALVAALAPRPRRLR